MGLACAPAAAVAFAATAVAGENAYTGTISDGRNCEGIMQREAALGCVLLHEMDAVCEEQGVFLLHAGAAVLRQPLLPRRGKVPTPSLEGVLPVGQDVRERGSTEAEVASALQFRVRSSNNFNTIAAAVILIFIGLSMASIHILYTRSTHEVEAGEEMLRNGKEYTVASMWSRMHMTGDPHTAPPSATHMADEANAVSSSTRSGKGGNRSPALPSLSPSRFGCC
mmetsp:Transcript_87701/g.204049  ORF Transcript_87701/g.204049 Transcript_87701/m.204049 type:complete len:224 (+) Transcript_87701:70-741(+)